jgi:TM2 domain-containing membrane protein YozV
MNEGPWAPPGWYPVGAGERYWDGRAWTSHTRPPMAPAVEVETDAHGLPHQVAGAPRARADWPPPAPSVGPTGPTGPVYYARVAPKSPAVSVLASFFLPGLGSMINGDVAKGIGILIGYLVSCVLVIVLIGIVGVFGFWVWGMVDAAAGARRWNARHGILS